MLRIKFVALILLGVVCAFASVALSSPMLFSHQGRILDGTGQPLNGVVPIKFSLFDSSSDGVEVWTETHQAVTVTDGLYSVLLGSVTPLSADLFAAPPSSGAAQHDLYLEIEVNGSVLSPRSQIISTPYSAVSTRVDGDLQTGPGMLRVDYLDPDDDGDGLLFNDDLDSSVLALSEKDGLGGSNALTYKFYQPGQPQYGNIVFEHSSSGQPPDTSYQFDVRADARIEKFNVKESFGPSHGTKSSRQGVTDSAGFVDASSSDGMDSSSAVMSAGVDRSVLKNYFETGDVPTESQFGVISDTAVISLSHNTDAGNIDCRVTPEVSSVAIKTKGTGADPNRVVSISSSASDSGVIDLSLDDNGNGSAKARGIISVKASTGVGSVTSRMTTDNNENGNPESEALTTVTADSILDVLESDSDDDGVAEVSDKRKIIAGTFSGGPGTVNLRVVDIDGDGVPESSDETRLLAHEVTHTVQQKSGSGVEQRTMTSETTSDTSGVSSEMRVNKGINEQLPYATLRTSVSTQSLVCAAGLDIDQDGNTDVSATEKVLPSGASHSIVWNSLTDPGVSHKLRLEADSAKSELVSSIDLDGDGLSDVATSETCTADSASQETSFDYPNAQTPSSTSSARVTANRKKCLTSNFHLSPLSRTEASSTCDSTTSSSSWTADDFSGALASLTIQVSTDTTLNPIQHSSGAHLTPGGDWTNASDVNRKENFEPVDGDDLLKKIESLDISEWNYKSESDDVKHIGPTAQDFKKTFGVGSDGKSISTIDPAGIALAAIKALNEKSKKVDELEAKVNELTALVDKLVSEQKK